MIKPIEAALKPLKLVDRLILIDLVPRLFMYIAIFSTLFLTFGPVIAASNYIAAGFPWWIVAQFIGWNLTGFVSYTFPLGMLIAALLGFERLSGDSEAVALYAGGISFLRIIAPVFALGLMVSIVCYTFNDNIAPYANLQVAEFKDHRQDIVGENSNPFDLANRPGGKLKVTVHIEKGYDARTKSLRQVTITNYGADGRPTEIIYADRAQSLGNGLTSWQLLDALVVDTATAGSGVVHDLKYTVNLEKTPDNMAFLQRTPETLNFHDLQRQINQMKASSGSTGKEILNAEVGLWFKTSLPFSCLVFGLVGAPLGMRSPRSAKLSGALWALPIIMGYYVIYVILQNLAHGGLVPPLLAAWLPNILGLLVGAGLIWKASQ